MQVGYESEPSEVCKVLSSRFCVLGQIRTADPRLGKLQVWAETELNRRHKDLHSAPVARNGGFCSTGTVLRSAHTFPPVGEAPGAQRIVLRSPDQVSELPFDTVQEYRFQFGFAILWVNEVLKGHRSESPLSTGRQ
jgi:hypothetical protein